MEKIQFKKFAWHNLQNNEEPELRYVRDHFNFEVGHLQDVASPPLRPKIDFDEKYLFLVLLFPVHNRKTGAVIISELDIFLNKEVAVWVHKNDINAIRDIAQRMDNEPKFKEKYEHTTALVFVLDALEKLNLSLYPMLNHISWDIDAIDNQLFTGRERELINQILAIKRNIVAIQKTMRAQAHVLTEFEDRVEEYFGKKTIDKKTQLQFKRIISLSGDLWTQLENHKATIDAIQETNESLISFRLSDIMKTLTIFSVIVFPLTLLAAIFGMNTVEGMPFMNSGGGFWKVIAIMMTGTVCMFYWFKRRRWI
ncbi:hypothetical protein BK004_02685 [bacterium CG10_46_32]|nr:MAG: hypothetical protein BK004_02685 [bacterium CG10_46_32]PIR56108.1 MAG: hypothetical protein COU73_02710 [Parcubacteria group bacterium CG10_big_fil_rev_8_21_14_0_10_46_32]